MLNTALREGEPYALISARVAQLVGLAHPHLTPAMFSRWLRTGYRDWLLQKTHLEATLAQTDATLARLGRFRQETGASPLELADTLLASLLQTILQEFDPASLKTLLAEKPAEFFRLVACFNAHLTARARDKNAEVARARCQVEMAEKALTTRQTPDPANEVWEKQMVAKAFGGPVEQVARAFQIPHPSPDPASRLREIARKHHSTPDEPRTKPKHPRVKSKKTAPAVAQPSPAAISSTVPVLQPQPVAQTPPPCADDSTPNPPPPASVASALCADASTPTTTPPTQT